MATNPKSDSTTVPLLKYFVYELQDPKDNSVFYVGKGTARRAEEHEREALKTEVGESKKTDKITEIKSRVDDGENKVRIVIIGRYDSEEKAYAVESTLIKWVYGFDNLTNKVRGHNHNTIRSRGDIGMVKGIDKNKKANITGDYTQEILEKIADNQIMEKLEYLKGNLGKNGIRTSEPDISTPQDPTIWLKVNERLRIQIKLGLSGELIKLNYRISSPEHYHYFTKLMDGLGIKISKRNDKRDCYAAFSETRTKGSGGEGRCISYKDVKNLVKILQDSMKEISES